MANTIKIPIDFVPENSMLTFLMFVGRPKGKPTTYNTAIYKCKCGVEKEININNVKHGKQLSCGCYGKLVQSKKATTHGLSKHPLFFIWVDMKTRCYNQKSWAYPYYGGACVTVCDEWKNDFKAFYEWSILNGWEKGLRIDKDKIPKEMGVPAIIYSPQMCCYLTHKENCNNRRSNHRITFNGVTKNLTQWEHDLGFGKDVIYNRLKRGWSDDRAISTPLLRVHKK